MGRIKRKKGLWVRFRRQHPIDIFIVDFYCHEALLVIEVDGKIHLQQKDYDDGRKAEIEKFDIEVIRFTNQEVESDLKGVIQSITKKIQNRLETNS